MTQYIVSLAVQSYHPFLGCVLVRVSIAMLKHKDQREVAEEIVYFNLQLSGHSPSLRGVTAGTEGGTCRQALKQEPVGRH